MSNKRPSLDDLLAAVPRDVPPERDLWQGIQAEIAKTPIVTDTAPVVPAASAVHAQKAQAQMAVAANEPARSTGREYSSIGELLSVFG